MKKLHVVWFKRDLRVHDHAPLLAAVAGGAPVLPLYIFEPGYWSLPEHSARQFEFLLESLTDLDAALRARGSKLIVRTGDAVDVFADLHQRHGLAAIHAHEETGLDWVFARDRAVRRWALSAGVSVREASQNGVVRGLKSHNDWAGEWTRRMNAPRLKAPEHINDAGLPEDCVPIAADFGLDGTACPGRQSGGRSEGVALLRSFIAMRGRRYRQDMSSPLTAEDACSRLSPHLAFGTLSLREAFHAASRARSSFLEDGDATFAASLESFLSRLQWHCHFMQKLEDATSIEGRALNPSYDGVRPIAPPDDPRLAAWIEGRTGFPFVDACMRSLRETGWLNFRMRAMLIGFASHLLWLDWKRPAEMMAALFTDFEAGIHYPQAQMQAGTGASTPRVYNPVKQSLDQDPDGVFIRRWLPELAGLETRYLHAPWDAPKADLERAGIVLGQTYPMRLIDHMAAAREARGRLYKTAQQAGERRPSDLLSSSRPAVGAGMAWRGANAAKQSNVTRRSPQPKKAAPQLSLDFGLAS
jgi:deoxyribodipyrimidine photo-lyase